ncbi:hypothetical protein LTS08_005434 [Lithohypha guttulata]|uniref:uncharacterized protein n=1 Tax=Lithohypha guttulata TaxID=1690604 RepID=UPI002DE18CA5|nr:hypothetical protein LTR51_003387 [Lithohypha guttulata]KAK5099719.1 hypothetical protein LTS08_005434 [Lithohypha guttulata]
MEAVILSSGGVENTDHQRRSHSFSAPVPLNLQQKTERTLRNISISVLSAPPAVQSEQQQTPQSPRNVSISVLSTPGSETAEKEKKGWMMGTPRKLLERVKSRKSWSPAGRNSPGRGAGLERE